MGKAPKTNMMLYVKLASLADLARYVCNFDYTSSSIISIRRGGGYAIVCLGEETDGARLAFYVNIPAAESMICYTYPSSPGQPENAHFVKEVGSPPNHYMNILGLDGKNLREAKKTKPIQLVKAASPQELIVAVIKRGVERDALPHIYHFNKQGKTIYCAFDIIDELSDGPRTLYYATSDEHPDAGFARYKYADNKVDFTAYVGEHSYMYAKIINLAEPFSFFKMPE